ncbi:hypothetical protein BBP00_00002062 [Phytophthora kernoviae]|uniref:Proteasome assembly chaperone 1 n=1 Tax=Phytophthora kernoviae TaxID=325452 RepID=A0A3F2RYI4_9STRA|nr:hypothetical protein BBP00_00002062 [Phytophthora kernoviae]
MSQSSPLAPRVFLVFDDFSLAGKHVFPFAKFNGIQPQDVPQAAIAALFPNKLSQFIQVKCQPDNQAAFVTVNTTSLKCNERWELADTLVTAFDQSNVQEVAILAALHLPYAKDEDLNVFQCSLNEDTLGEQTKHLDTLVLPKVESKWEVKDPFLSALLHLIQVECAPRTHLLLAKGYKPGRDLSGTYDAVDALGKALQLFTRGQVTVDLDQMKRELPRVLSKEKVKNTESDDHLTLLYH